MKHRYLYLLALFAISSQAAAGDWGINASYGVLMPRDNQSTWPDVSYNFNETTETENLPIFNRQFTIKNSNYFDIGVSNKNNGIGFIYSASAKKTEFTPKETHDNIDNQNFRWSYRAAFVSYNVPVAKDFTYNIAFGRAKQNLVNLSHPLAKAKASSNDIALRFGFSAGYNISKDIKLGLSLAYHHFNDFLIQYTPDSNAEDGQLKSADPLFNNSGFAASLSLNYIS